MKPRTVWILVGALAVLHWDFWFWADRTLVFGFMPIGLLYHACFSCVAAATWALAVRFAWPRHIEAWADSGPSDDSARSTMSTRKRTADAAD